MCVKDGKDQGMWSRGGRKSGVSRWTGGGGMDGGERKEPDGNVKGMGLLGGRGLFLSLCLEAISQSTRLVRGLRCHKPNFTHI
jgi:hypothetical protein